MAFPTKKPQPGTVGVTRAVTKSGATVHQAAARERTETREGPAQVGFSFGLTIPGPDRSYLSGRVQVDVSLPSAADDASLNTTLERAKAIVEKHMDAEVAEIDAFFKAWVNGR